MLINLLNTLRLLGKHSRQQKLIQRDPDCRAYQIQVNRLQREKEMFYRLWQHTEEFQESEFCILKMFTKERARQALLDAWWFQQDKACRMVLV